MNLFKMCPSVSLIIVGFVGQAHATVVEYTVEGDFISAVGSTLFIDFDLDASGNSIAAETVIDQQYNSLGIDFNPFNSGNPKTATASLFMPAAVSEPNLLRTVPGDTGYSGGGFEVVFDNPAVGIGMFFGDIQSYGLTGVTTLELFDASGTSIHVEDVTTVLGDSTAQWKFLGLTSTQPFARAQVSIGGEDFVIFDNLRFAVPEPSSLCLLVLGSIVMMRRRRSS